MSLCGVMRGLGEGENITATGEPKALSNVLCLFWISQTALSHWSSRMRICPGIPIPNVLGLQNFPWPSVLGGFRNFLGLMFFGFRVFSGRMFFGFRIFPGFFLATDFPDVRKPKTF